MKIIIAPAKKMKIETDSFESTAVPAYIEETKQILAALRQLSYHEVQLLWKCSDKLAQVNYEWLQKMDLNRQLTPAIMAYVGIQYQYMAPDLMTQKQLEYIQENLKILSGFYGILRPFDGIVPYRLEMQAKLKIGEYSNLYQMWGSKLYDKVYEDHQIVVNLASKEYEKAVRPYLKDGDEMITCIFGEIIDGKVKQKATPAKEARGEMVNFMAKNQIHEIDDLKSFDRLNYTYSKELSSINELVFIKS
jgi:cytoplasmic iron level regulating protein YaaA (DUF328/UPF0246 family)